MAEAKQVDRRTLRRRRTRRDIIAAAWVLAERDGIAAISLRDLAAAVGMQAPSLYTYFDSKGAIYDALFAQGYREMDEQLGALERDGGTTREALIANTEAFLRFCQASLPRYQLMFTRVLPDWEPSAEAYAASVASYERMAGELRALGIEGQDALDRWTAIIAGLAAQQLANDPEGDRWVRQVPAVVDMFLAHLTTEATP